MESGVVAGSLRRGDRGVWVDLLRACNISYPC